MAWSKQLLIGRQGRAVARSPWRWIMAYRDLARSRRSLARLDSRLLDDVALDPEVAQAEAARRLWDAPAHWYRDRSRWS